jgi:HipA-like protein
MNALKRWAKRFQVSALRAFETIAHMGEDSAGAVQDVGFSRTEWLDE